MMNHDWNTNDTIEHLTLLPPEISFLGRNAPHNHLGKALLLKFFQKEARFPEEATEIPSAIVEYVAQQLDLPPEVVHKYQWKGRRFKEHKREIRELLGFHPATLVEQDKLRAWLMAEVLPGEHRPTYLEQLIYQQLRRSQLEPPSKKQVARLIKSAIHRYEQAFFARTTARLSETVRANLRQLIYAKTDLAIDLDLEEQDENDDARLIEQNLSHCPLAKFNLLMSELPRLTLIPLTSFPYRNRLILGTG